VGPHGVHMSTPGVLTKGGTDRRAAQLASFDKLRTPAGPRRGGAQRADEAGGGIGRIEAPTEDTFGRSAGVGRSQKAILRASDR
jgi:hypothetical protein